MLVEGSDWTQRIEVGLVGTVVGVELHLCMHREKCVVGDEALTWPGSSGVQHYAAV